MLTQVADGRVNAERQQLPAPAQAAMPSPDLVGDLLARAFERVLQWPCPECGQPFPCACDGLQPQRMTELTDSLLSERQANAAQQ